MYAKIRLFSETANNFAVFLCLTAELGVGTGTADLRVTGGSEGRLRGENLSDLLLQKLVEMGTIRRNVGNALLAETKHGVVVVGTGVLDEEQGGGHLKLCLKLARFGLGRITLLATDDIRIDKGLEVVVGMLVDVLGQEDGVNIGQGLQATTASLVVYHADGSVAELVETVYSATNFH